MPQTFQATQWVPFPVELVFAFFANPANLPHLMPKWQRARIENSRLVAPPRRPLAPNPELRFQSQAAGVGSEMDISFRPVRGVPFRIGWTARITEFEWNSHFRDEQVSGPFASWRHRHGIVAEAGTAETEESAGGEPIMGTRVTDEVEYEVPLAPLGNALFLPRQVEAMFEFRRHRLKEILPVAARQAMRRG